MQKRYAVIGLGRFGSSVAKVLHEMGHFVLAIDHDASRVDALASVFTHIVRANTVDPATVKALRLHEFDGVVVAVGDDVEGSVITCLNCRDVGVKMLVAKAQDDQHGRVLERIGVDRVVYPQRDMGERVAHNLSAGGIIDYVRLSEKYGMAELEASGFLTGHSLLELDLRNKYGLNVITIKRGKNLIVSPEPGEIITAGDILVVIGDAEGVNLLQSQ